MGAWPEHLASYELPNSIQDDSGRVTEQLVAPEGEILFWMSEKIAMLNNRRFIRFCIGLAHLTILLLLLLLLS